MICRSINKACFPLAYSVLRGLVSLFCCKQHYVQLFTISKWLLFPCLFICQHPALHRSRKCIIWWLYEKRNVCAIPWISLGILPLRVMLWLSVSSKIKGFEEESASSILACCTPQSQRSGIDIRSGCYFSVTFIYCCVRLQGLLWWSRWFGWNDISTVLSETVFPLGKTVEHFIRMEQTHERIIRQISKKKVFIGLVGEMC